MDDFVVQMETITDEVREDVKSVAKASIKTTAKETSAKLKNVSPKKTGDYARGWTVKNVDDMTQIVFNKTDWQLTHLLNDGHIIKNKYGEYGRVAGDNHIDEVESWAAETLAIKISRGLN